MDDFVRAAEAKFGRNAFTALEALDQLQPDVLPVQTRRLLGAGRPGSNPAKSLGLFLARMEGIERVTGRTNVGVLWRVSA